MTKNIIITGSMGGGKSTVLKLLRAEGIMVVEEPAREILAEQRSIEGTGVPEKDPKLFTQLLLSRAIYQYKQMQDTSNTVLFDRGIPDNIAYARLFEFDYLPAQQAAKLYQYHVDVFIFPAWEQIYTHDEERKMSFAAAKAFGEDVERIYKDYGYNLIKVPCLSPDERARFIRERI